MSYQVLARKWRPRQFVDVVGQAHVLKALVNSLDQNRVHHAFLFTGTRGVGKTTIARILAKALNCDQGVSGTPCNECGSCQDIDAGRFVDLIEIDAASRTGVDDIREVLENVQYSPARGRYKVYLIDEVHMLSNAAFNALLKTLEEPPEHVKFLLATTDPQKLPITVLSRCMQFHLRKLSSSAISTHLAKVLTAESVPAEETALDALARAAEGSVRDALSLLDQAIAFGGDKVETQAVLDMLGSVTHERFDELLQAIAASDGSALLATVAELDSLAIDPDTVLSGLASRLQQIAVGQLAPSAVKDAENTLSDELITLFSAEQVQLFYDICLGGRADLRNAPDPRSGLEMTLLRMLAFRQVEINSPIGSEKKNVEIALVTPTSATLNKSSAVTSAEKTSNEPASVVAAFDASQLNWAEILPRMQIRGRTKELAMHCTATQASPERLLLTVNRSGKALFDQKVSERLKTALCTQLSNIERVEIELASTTNVVSASTENRPSTSEQQTAATGQQLTPAQQRKETELEEKRQALRAINEDPNIVEFQELFGAELSVDSITPGSHKQTEG